MNFIAVTGLLLTAIVSGAYTQTPTLRDNHPFHRVVHYDENLKITRKCKSLYSNLGVVPNVRQCGGTGRVLQWRDEPCTQNTVPCVLPAGQTFFGEITFIPSDYSESMGLRIVFKDTLFRTEITSFQTPNMPDSRVEAGKDYTLSGGAILNPELRGKLITLQASIYRESDKKVEICAEADFLIAKR